MRVRVLSTGTKRVSMRNERSGAPERMRVKRESSRKTPSCGFLLPSGCGMSKRILPPGRTSNSWITRSIPGAGLNHLAYCLGSVHAPHRSRGVASKVRSSFRVGDFVCAVMLSASPFGLLLAGEVGRELVEARVPDVPVAVHPILELAERLPAKRVEPTLGVLPDVDEARFVQKTQLLGDAWLVDVDLVHELAHGALALAERADEPPA